MIALSELINLLTVIFVTASISLAILNKFSHPSIPAYILAGLVLSPFVPEDSLLSLSQLGIIFLVFIFGIKFDPTRLRTVARESRSSAVLQITVVGGLAAASAMVMKLGLTESIYFGLFAAISSSLVGLRLIDKEVQVDLVHGRLAESIHLIQDVIAIGIIIILTSTSPTIAGVLTELGFAALLLTVGLFFRTVLFDLLTKTVGDSRELLMVSSLALLSAFLGASQVLGLNMVIGAFSAGIAFARFPQNMEILDTTGSLKDFFSAIFFISLGTLVAIPTVQTLSIAVLLIAFTAIIKPAVTTLSLQLQGFDDRTSHLTGFSLDQVSEFSLILGITAYLSGGISSQLFDGLILAAAVTMITSAYTSRHEEQLYRKASALNILPSFRKIQESSGLENLQEHVVLIGYGVQGRQIIQKLEEEGKEFAVVENDPEKIEEMKEKGINYVYGDVMDEETWEKVKIKKADLIVSTVPVDKISWRILEIETEADKILRAETVQGASKFLENGAIYVNIPDFAGSEVLIDHIQGVIQNLNYREELRRKNLLQLREQQNQ